VSGFKAAKDGLMLLLGADVSGTLKLEPMLVYHSQTQRALKGLNKAISPVYWKWIRRSWVSQEIFLDWYTKYFCTNVLCFCQENELPAKTLLLLDNVMPSNTTSLCNQWTKG
jgi:DDE superfamily endonuclease.